MLVRSCRPYDDDDYPLVPCLVPLYRNHIDTSAPDYAFQLITNVSSDFFCAA
jgi:hypothetical protein